MKTRKRPRQQGPHYKHVAFQKALGDHCRKLRMKQGFSVNRLAREGERLSPDVVLRLESGGVVTTTTLYRYAEVLGLSVKELFSFSFSDES